MKRLQAIMQSRLDENCRNRQQDQEGFKFFKGVKYLQMLNLKSQLKVVKSLPSDARTQVSDTWSKSENTEETGKRPEGIQ